MPKPGHSRAVRPFSGQWPQFLSWPAEASNIELLDVAKGAPQGFAPVARQFLEIGIVTLDPANPVELERVPGIDRKVDRQADAQIGADGGIEGEQDELRRFAKPHRGIADPVE